MKQLKANWKKERCYLCSRGQTRFYLLQEMKRTGADKLLIEEVNKGKLYIGESAGAIVVAPDIEYSSAIDSKEKP